MTRLRPGDDLPQAIRKADGAELVLSAGTYTGGQVQNVRRPVLVRGEGLVIITGGLKLEGCGPVTLTDLETHGAPTHGFMIVRCEQFQGTGLVAKRCKGSGILTANTSYVSLADCLCDGSLEGHGIYLSQSGDVLRIMDSTCRDNARCGIQVNAIQPGRKPHDPTRDSISRGVVISGNTLQGNQTQGAAAINLAGCRDVQITRNRILGHRGRSGLSLWDDGAQKRELACHAVNIEQNEFSFVKDTGAVCVSVGPTCSGVRLQGNVCGDGVTLVTGPYVKG